MRLIDADALADAIFDKRKNYPQWVADVIGSMPEAVVRCKDCKWRYPDGNCDYGNKAGDWYCADGQKKGEGE